MKSLFIEQANAHLRYHDLAGAGTPCIFVHGLGCAASCDYPQVAFDPALTGRRMLLVDLLGSGFSDRPDGFSYSIRGQARTIAALVEHIGVGAVDIFGHSMGGAIAIEAARLLGDQVQHLVLSEPNLDAGGGYYSRKIAEMAEADYVSKGHNDLAEASRLDGSGIWAASLLASAPFVVYRGAVSLVAGGNPEWREMLYALPFPKTVIFGSQSLPDNDTEELPLNGVHVGVVQDAGHMMAWENPSGLAHAIREATLA